MVDGSLFANASACSELAVWMTCSTVLVCDWLTRLARYVCPGDPAGRVVAQIAPIATRVTAMVAAIARRCARRRGGGGVCSGGAYTRVRSETVGWNSTSS